MKSIVLVLYLLVLACSNSITPQPLKTGVWFGNNTAVNVGQNGMTIEFTCASAFTNKKIELDANNSFKNEGLFQQRFGNIPIGFDATKFQYAVSFEGKLVSDDSLYIRVTKIDENKLLAFTKVKYGAEGNVKKCP